MQQFLKKNHLFQRRKETPVFNKEKKENFLKKKRAKGSELL